MGIESVIEKDAREYIESRGGNSRKWVSPGNAGVPDRILSHPRTGPFAVEYKPPGDALKPHQQQTCIQLAREGWRVYAGRVAGGKYRGVNSIHMAREIIDDEIAGTPGRRHPYLDGLD